MPTLDFIDINDTVNSVFSQATITAIDTATDTCTITIDGESVTALIFYH